MRGSLLTLVWPKYSSASEADSLSLSVYSSSDTLPAVAMAERSACENGRASVRVSVNVSVIGRR